MFQTAVNAIRILPMSNHPVMDGTYPHAILMSIRPGMVL